MRLDRARRTRRPSIVWLDDKISLMLEQVGHLNSRGFDVSPTASITEFLRALQNQTINIAVIDIKLEGGEDGRALIDLVYENRPEIGIIVHSNYPDDFLGARYDSERVRFVRKNTANEPIEINDPWPLADAAVALVDTLNKRRAGLNPYPVSLNTETRKHILNWATVQSIRRFATDHAIIPVIILLLLVKAALLSNTVEISTDLVLAFLYQVVGFALPFLVALALAWYFTPLEIREASSPDKFVQVYFDRLAGDDDLRANINRRLSESGQPIPQDDLSVLRTYYELLVTMRLWLARVILTIFFLGTAYLFYDVVRDVLHLFGTAYD